MTIATTDLFSRFDLLDTDRVRRTLFIVICCGFVVLLSKSLSLPETALSAYLVFFVTREDGTATAGAAAALCVVAPLAIGLTIILIMATAGAPLLRIVAMFGVAFIAMWAARATTAGVIAATIGMAMFEVLSVLDYLAYPDLLLRALFWLMTVVLVPMAVLILASLLFAPSASSRLEAALSRRLCTIQQAVIDRGPKSQAACRGLLRNSVELSLPVWRRLAYAAGRLDKKGANRAYALQKATGELLIDCAVGRIPEDTPDARQALSLQSDATPQDPRLLALVSETVIAEPTENKAGNHDTVRFALKSTIAIALCYTVFTLLQWPAIHTITITAFLVCVGSTAETLHKSALRLSGCLVGAVLSLAALLLVVPNITGAGGLAVLTTLALIPAAWIATGSERVSYAGMQIALVFLLSVVNTTGPEIDFGVTWGRIVGILLGNVLVTIVFTTLWPASLKGSIEDKISAAEQAEADNDLYRAANEIVRIRDELSALQFEPGMHSARQAMTARVDALEARLFA